MQVSFIVPGEPCAKGRPRFGQGRTYTPESTRNYEEWVAWHARTAMRGKDVLRGPLCLQFKAVHAIPASWSKKRREANLVQPEFKGSRPDIDNVEKAVTDAMNGIVYGDDGQIALLQDCMKVWGDEPRIEITVRELHGSN
jgi:Holliday junction resolvase RusA-like endonuclease